MSDQEEEEKEMQIQEKKPKRRVSQDSQDEFSEQQEVIQPDSQRYQQQQQPRQQYDDDDDTIEQGQFQMEGDDDDDKPKINLAKLKEQLKRYDRGYKRKVRIAGEIGRQQAIQIDIPQDVDRSQKIEKRVQSRTSTRIQIKKAQEKEKQVLKQLQEDDQAVFDGYYKSKEKVSKQWDTQAQQQAEFLDQRLQYLVEIEENKQKYVEDLTQVNIDQHIQKPYFSGEQVLTFENIGQDETLAIVDLIKQHGQMSGDIDSMFELFDIQANDVYSEIISFTALFITISDQFADITLKGPECPLSLQQFEKICQAHNSIDFDYRRQLPVEQLSKDPVELMKEIVGNDTEMNYLFFTQLVYFLFQDSYSQAAVFQRIIAGDDIRHQAPDWLKNVKGAVKYFDSNRWRDEFIENDGSEYIYEDVANRLNVSKLQIIRTYKFIFLLIKFCDAKFVVPYNKKIFDFRAAIKWMFLPRNLKDVSELKQAEMQKMQIKPIFGSICHFLIQVCIQIEIFSRYLFTDRFNQRTMDFHQTKFGQVAIDPADWVDQRPPDQQIEVKEVDQIMKSKRIKKFSSEKAFFESYRNKTKKQIEQIKAARKLANKKRAESLKELQLDNDLQSTYVQKVYCQVGAQEQRLFRPNNLNTSVGGLDVPKNSLPVQQYVNGQVLVRRDFIECFNNVQRNLDVVSKLLIVIRENSIIESISMGRKQHVHHYIQLTISAFYRPEERGDDQQQRKFTTVGFKFSDSESLEKLTENQISQLVASNVYNKIIFIIAQHLEYYLEAEDNFDSMRIDFSSLCIDKFSVSTIHEGFKLYNNVIKLNDGEFRYHVMDYDIGRIVAYFKGDIANDPQYIKSKVEDFDDDDDFQCTMNVASYLWCKLNNKPHNKDSKLAFFFSEEYQYLEKFVIEGLINEVFRYFKQNKKMSVVLFFPQTFVMYKSANFQEDSIWIFVKLGHCWIGKHKEMFNDAAKIDKKLVKDKFAVNNIENIYEQKKQSMLRVFSLPKSMRSGLDSEITFVFYDIETLQNERGKHQLQQPFLLCYRVEELDFSKGQIRERGHFLSENCCEQFVDFLDQLSLRLAQKKKEIMIQKKLKSIPNSKIIVYAHNGGKFDHLFLQQAIMKKHSKSYKFLGTPTNLKWASYNNIVFRDSVMLLPGKLDDLCKSFKIKGKNDFDASTITKQKLEDPEYRQLVIDYCYQDVDCLAELIFAFKQKFGEIIKDFKFSDIKQTLPATALHVFQKFFMTKGVQIYGNLLSSHQGVTVQNFERASYRGGHCQVFKHGRESDLVYWDFVSMYVSIMYKGLFPLSQGQIEMFNNKIETTCLYILKSFKFKDGQPITNIPLRDIETNITVYPLQFKSGDAGQAFVAVWGSELQLAYEFLGLEIAHLKVDYVVRYAHWGNEFTKYMGTFFDIKDNAGPDEEGIKIIAKLFGNSLYGKLGQKNETSRQLISVAEARILGENGLQQMLGPPAQFFHYQKKADKNQDVIRAIQKLSENVLQIIFEDPSGEFRSSGSIVRIASFITMLGRCKLIKLINEIGFENIRYCDTDSVVFKPYKKMKVTTKVGKKLGDVSDQLPGCRVCDSDFIAAKCYYLELDRDPKFKSYKGKYEYVRFKGVSKPTIQQIKDLRSSGSASIRQQQFRRRWNGVGVEEIEKQIRLGTKRFVKQDGTTRPFNDWSEYQNYFNKVLTFNENKFEYIN